MTNVYLKTLELLSAILLGFFLKKAQKLTAQDTQTISKLVLSITLPCVIIKSLSNITLSSDLLAAAGIGLLANGALLLSCYLFFGKKDADRWISAIFSMTTFNISSFAVPVLAPFVSAEVMAGVLSFNLPTSIFTYSIVPSCAILHGGAGRHDLTDAFKKLLHSVPTLTCLCMFLLAAFHVSLPKAVISVAGSFSAANTFLAMLAVGSLMSFSLTKEALRQNLLPIVLRLATVCMLAAFLCAMPISTDLRNALAMSLFAPAASCCPMLALQSGYKGGNVAVTNSAYLLLSVIILTALSALLYG